MFDEYYRRKFLSARLRHLQPRLVGQSTQRRSEMNRAIGHLIDDIGRWPD